MSPRDFFRTSCPPPNADLCRFLPIPGRPQAKSHTPSRTTSVGEDHRPIRQTPQLVGDEKPVPVGNSIYADK
jgi:hypothetical protein